MPQPGMSGMEPVFGEAYGGHRGLVSPCPLAMSPQGGKTDYDQTVLLMLSSPASLRKRPFELLSDLLDDGAFGEDQHPERWDVSALDEMTRYTKLGLGAVGGLLACSEEGVLLGCWGRSREEDEEERRKKSCHSAPAVTADACKDEEGKEPVCVPALTETAAGQNVGTPQKQSVEVYQVAQKEEDEQEEEEEEKKKKAAAVKASGLTLEHCSEEHNYSLNQAGEVKPGCTHSACSMEVQEEEKEHEEQYSEENQDMTEPEEEEKEDGEEEQEVIAEETSAEAELSSSSDTECEVEAEPVKQPGERPSKRRCFWEYRRMRESTPKKKPGDEVHWSLSWSSSTLPSTLYRREGKKGRRKARKTDASDLTPNPQKLHNIGEQLQKLNSAIDGMGAVNELPAVARARSRKEKNKLASRACRLKKKAQHEANKIKLWGLNQEYENLLAALLRIKDVIRQRVEGSGEDDPDDRGMTRRLEDILRESSGPLVAGRTKDFVQKILAASGSGQSQRGGEQAEG